MRDGNTAVKNRIRVEAMQNQKKGKHKGKIVHEINTQINKTYGKWKPITELRRSFFIWMGQYAQSPKESEVGKILKGENLRYYREVSFDMVKRFDFYVPLLDLVIEYDGSQHFTCMKNIKNDTVKDNILIKLGVRLIRYNKTHKLSEQIKHDLIHHPVLKN